MKNTDYLSNDVCKFYPLFEIDFSKRKTIISVVLFKLYNGGYKSFDLYIDGLERMNEYVRSRYKNTTVRLFIDNTIFYDKPLMNRLEGLDIELVRFVPRPEFMIKGHLKGLFGTLIRFFPMFDFPNNDCDLCVLSDIDLLDDEEVRQRFGFVEENYINNFEDPKTSVCIACESYLEVNRDHYNVKYDMLLPYFHAGAFETKCKFDKRVLIDFLEGVEQSKEVMTVYPKHKNAKLGYTNFVYGVDEYFLNSVLVDYIVEKKIGITLRARFNVISNLRKRLGIWDLEPERRNADLYRQIMAYVLGKEHLKMNPRNSFIELERRSGDPDVLQRLIEAYMLILRDGSEKYDIQTRNIIDVCTHSVFLGTVFFDGFVSYNNPKFNLIIDSEKKLPEENIKRLKAFKKKFDVEDAFVLP